MQNESKYFYKLIPQKYVLIFLWHFSEYVKN